jgi:[acyl-carrier-protein] S-malonyltransferase
MTAKDAFSVVRKRGIYMQEAVPTGGAMSAVLGLDADTIAKICKETENSHTEAEPSGGNLPHAATEVTPTEVPSPAATLPYVVSIANYNCPGQIVITGREDAVAEAGERCKEAGAKRIVPLKVSGPFHSALLEGAGAKLGEALAEVGIHEMTIPYLANVTADYVTDAADVKPLLTRQVSASVRWQQTIERLIADGADEFVEIGPGRSLSGFMKKINRDVTAYNIDTMEDFENYVSR